jgi:hypothetical protein
MSSGLHPADSQVYTIRIEGALSESWSEWFGGMAIEVEETAGMVRATRLTGALDHSGLHGILASIRDLNLKLISVGYAGAEKPRAGLEADEGSKEGSEM